MKKHTPEKEHFELLPEDEKTGITKRNSTANKSKSSDREQDITKDIDQSCSTDIDQNTSSRSVNGGKKLVLKVTGDIRQKRESSPWLSEGVIGLDVGDSYSNVCVLCVNGTIAEETRIPTTEEGVRKYFLPDSLHILVVIEVGGQSMWLSQLLEDLGYEVLIASPGRLKDLYRGKDKTDQLDAYRLAKIGLYDPSILAPVMHKTKGTYADMSLIQGRDLLVRQRTSLINFVRGKSKLAGNKISSCATYKFHNSARQQLPESLQIQLEPILTVIGNLSEQIADFDIQIKSAAMERYPVVERLCQVPGIGLNTAMAFVLTVEDPYRFNTNDEVASYLRLVPRKKESGKKKSVIRPTDTGQIARGYLIQAAKYHLRSNGVDTAIHRWGRKIVERGGNRPNRHAAIATARKFSALLLQLWKTGEDYRPFN